LTTLFTRAFKDLTKPHGKGKGKEKGKEKEQEKEIGIPEGYLTETEKKAQKVKNNTQLMVRIGTWFGRRPTTLWTVYEAEAFLRLDIDEDEDFVMLEQYYTADAKDFDRDYRRRDLGTLLNNWNTELDRARAWRSGNNRPDDGRPGGKYVRPA